MSGLVGYGNNPVKIVAGANLSGSKEWQFDKNGNLRLPQGGDILNNSGTSVLNPFNTGNIVFANDTITNANLNSDINITTNSLLLGSFTWNFASDGKLTLPSDGQINQNFSIIKTSISDMTDSSISSVIWTSSDRFTSSAKLLILVEQDPGDSTPDNSQTCEAIISAKGAGGISTDVPVISVYGITYTSLNPLATFSVQRNLSSGLIEVIATLIDNNDPAYFRIHSTELLSRG